MFKKFITENNLIEKKDKIVIAFSGGPDSVFLLEKLLEIKEEYALEISLAYVNHNIRDDVYKDIEFVKKISEKYNLQFKILEIKMEKFSENLARNLRYEAIENYRKEIKYNKIATGHNKTDNAETIIFNIIRGTGISGLKGIKIKRENIIRPILYIKKDEILKNIKNTYIIDKTNNENNYSRNKIRNLIFPIFNDINSSYIDNILKVSTNLENDEYKENLIRKFLEKKIELNYKKINNICNLRNENGTKWVSLGNNYYWYKSYSGEKILKKEEFLRENEEVKLYIENEIEYNGYIIGFSKNLEKKLKNNYNILELDNLENKNFLTIRTKKPGDRISNKKLKKLFIDNKIDKIERDNMPVILDKENIIMVGDKFKIKNSNKINYIVYLGRKDEIRR